MEETELQQLSNRSTLPPSSSSSSVPGSVVDVDEAVKEFHHLEQSVHDDQKKERDVNELEKGGAEWDIQEFFEDSVRKGEQTGHKLKRMGVVVKNLNVVGMGADAASIPDNLDILKALWPPTWYSFFNFFIFLFFILFLINLFILNG